MPGYRETGQIAYEAYAGRLGWSLYGQHLPPWDQLPEHEKDAFREAAHEVIQKGWTNR